MHADKKDNSTFERKAALRARALRARALMYLKVPPVVMETHGGFGKIFQRCYRHLPQGIVFESDETKSAALAGQRPTWAVYECACEPALAAGVGSHLEVNFLDLDPYGEPWEAVTNYFGSKRPFASRMIVVVNDGLRQKLRMQGGWVVKSMQHIVRKEGNGWLYKNYLEISRDLLAEKAARQGYKLSLWNGYYTGAGQSMTHYAAVLDR